MPPRRTAPGPPHANAFHAGYDPEPGTLMAKLNARGSAMIEQLCDDLAAEYQRVGSLVLAFSARDDEALENCTGTAWETACPASNCCPPSPQSRNT